MLPPVLLALTLSAGAQPPAPVTRAQYLMGTVCEMTAYGREAGAAITAAFSEIKRLDRVMSLYKDDSELSALNREAAKRPFPCSESLWEAVTASLKAAQDSGGAFDPTILPVLQRGPRSLVSVGYQKLQLDSERRAVFFTRPGMGLDFGGIGKGIALDHAARLLKDRGISAAFINFGGQILAFGSPPGATGWKVRIPGQEQELEIREASVSTSGNSEQPGHIASPFTGKRIMDPESVTVISRTGTEADAWSTALFVLGRKIPPAFQDCVFYTRGERATAVACGPNARGPSSAR